MKEIKFNKTIKEDELIVDVKLPRRKFSKEPVIQFSNSEMLEYLANEGIAIEEYDITDQPPSYLTSYADKRNEPILDGTWTFKKKVQKKVNKPKTRSYNKSKTKGEQKSGD